MGMDTKGPWLRNGCHRSEGVNSVGSNCRQSGSARGKGHHCGGMDVLVVAVVAVIELVVAIVAAMVVAISVIDIGSARR